MKKIISFAAAAILALSAFPMAFAQAEPTIKVDGRMVDFRDDQAPVIMNDRLYVPIRRVLEQMGTTVLWDGEQKMVTVKSYNNIIKLNLTIDSKEIKKYTFTSVLKADEEIITSDVAPVIINDRTMLPIRVIAEALDSTVVWDDETRLTTITTRQAKRVSEYIHGASNATSEEFDVADFYKDKVPALSISCDAEDVNEGDIVEIDIKLSDIEKAGENKLFTILTASVFYNENNFTYSGYDFIVDGEKVKASAAADNANFMPGLVKLVAVNTYMNAYKPGEDGIVAKMYFKALNGDGGEFALSNGVTDIGPNTSVTLYEEVEEAPVLTSLESHDQLYIDTSVVTVK